MMRRRSIGREERRVLTRFPRIVIPLPVTMKITFLKQAKLLVRNRLEQIGFVASQRLMRRPMINSMVGTIGRNDRTTRNAVDWEVNPVIGVYSIDLGDLKAELTATSDPYSVPHISTPLGYLMPEKTFRMWHFEDGIDNEAVADDMIESIRQYGVPWMEAHASLDAMCAALRTGQYGWPSQIDFSLPVCLLLLDRVDEALRTARQNMAKRSRSGGEYEEDYRRFVDALEARAASM